MDPAQVVNTTFIPCGHTNCLDCTTKMKDAGQHRPKCRQDASETMNDTLKGIIRVVMEFSNAISIYEILKDIQLILTGIGGNRVFGNFAHKIVGDFYCIVVKYLKCL